MSKAADIKEQLAFRDYKDWLCSLDYEPSEREIVQYLRSSKHRQNVRTAYTSMTPTEKNSGK